MSRRMPEGLHDEVVERDRMCFLYRLDDTHRCATGFGLEHAPTVLFLLTVDHFWHLGARLGRKAPHDRYHLVAMCHRGNVGAPSHEVREAERSYIRMKYPDWTVTDEETR